MVSLLNVTLVDADGINPGFDGFELISHSEKSVIEIISYHEHVLPMNFDTVAGAWVAPHVAQGIEFRFLRLYPRF